MRKEALSYLSFLSRPLLRLNCNPLKVPQKKAQFFFRMASFVHPCRTSADLNQFLFHSISCCLFDTVILQHVNTTFLLNCSNYKPKQPSPSLPLFRLKFRLKFSSKPCSVLQGSRNIACMDPIQYSLFRINFTILDYKPTYHE